MINGSLEDRLDVEKSAFRHILEQLPLQKSEASFFYRK